LHIQCQLVPGDTDVVSDLRVVGDGGCGQEDGYDEVDIVSEDGCQEVGVDVAGVDKCNVELRIDELLEDGVVGVLLYLPHHTAVIAAIQIGEQVGQEADTHRCANQTGGGDNCR
jgi:hypothetical protein